MWLLTFCFLQENQKSGSAKSSKSSLSRQGSLKSVRSAKSAKSVTWSNTDSDKDLIENEEKEKKRSLCARIVAGNLKNNIFRSSDINHNKFVMILLVYVIGNTMYIRL